MKLSISWGWKIAFLYGGFVVMILFLVWKSVVKKIDLVADNYYEQELKFQNRIDQTRRASSLPVPLKWSVSDAKVHIQYPASFPGGAIHGKVYFYCPSDNRKDISFPITTDENMQQVIPFSKLSPGRYQIQIDWKANGETYWNEGIVNI